jgi:hypothetical protein
LTNKHRIFTTLEINVQAVDKTPLEDVKTWLEFLRFTILVDAKDYVLSFLAIGMYVILSPN